MKTAFTKSSAGRTGILFLSDYLNADYDNALALHKPKSPYIATQ